MGRDGALSPLLFFEGWRSGVFCNLCWDEAVGFWEGRKKGELESRERGRFLAGQVYLSLLGISEIHRRLFANVFAFLCCIVESQPTTIRECPKRVRLLARCGREMVVTVGCMLSGIVSTAASTKHKTQNTPPHPPPFIIT